jgi:hypothetical protein
MPARSNSSLSDVSWVCSLTEWRITIADFFSRIYM